MDQAVDMKFRLWRKKFPSNNLRRNFIEPRKKDIYLFEPITGIIGAISALLGTTVGTIAGITISVGTLLKAAFLAVAIGSALWASTKKPKLSFKGSIANNGHLVNTKEATQPLKVVYGKFKVGGNWVCCEPSRENNNYLNIITTWGEGELDGVNKGIDYNALFSGTGINDLHPGGEIDYSGCSCNMTCYEYAACTCNMTFYPEGKYCTCHMSCYGYAGCTCDMAEYGLDYLKYVVEIDSTGAVDTFKWSDDGGSTWAATGIAITAEPQTLNNGVTVTFEAITGHVLGDSWTFYIGDAIWLGERLIYYYKDYGGLDLAFHEFYPGSSSQGVSPAMQAEVPLWNETMRYTAYSYFRLIYNVDAWKSVPEMTILLRGRKLYDPRNGSTVWSRNPALVWLDFMTNMRYGLGIPLAHIDLESVSDAATWLDDNDYHFDGAVIDRQAFIDNLDDIMANFRAFAIYSDGLYKLKIHTDDAAVMSLTEDDIDISPENFSIHIAGMPETPYKVKCVFPEAENNYTVNSASSEDGEQIAIDGDPRELEIILNGTVKAAQAANLAHFYRMRNKFNTEFEILGHPRLFALEPGDMVNVSHEFLTWGIESELLAEDSENILLEDEDTVLLEFPIKKLRVKSIGYPQEGMIPVTFMDEDASIYEEVA
jgi:hypothetical protein